MRRLLACCLILGCCWSAGPGWADEPAESEPLDTPLDTPLETPVESHIAELLEALDTADAELAEAQQQLETATTRHARRQLKATIRTLQATQADLLHKLEETLLGPRPPIVRDDPPTILEQQFEARQRHHEAILESNVELRLPNE